MDALQAVVSNLLQVVGEALSSIACFQHPFHMHVFPLDGSLKRKMAILATGNIFV